MDSRTIFSALCDRATAAAATTELPFSSSSPLSFAQQFSDAITGSLNSVEIQAVFDFLSPQNPSMMKVGDLYPKFEKMRHDFEKEELQLSEKESQKLVQHSGPLDAGVGVVLHVQHYKAEDEDTFIAGPFWDTHNQSVQVLAQKGFSDAFTFCFDWHWRAAAGPLGCPMKSWGRKLRACHDSFSLHVLDLIPCPLFIIGGVCAWESYTKAIPKSSKIVTFSTCEDVNVQFALEFNIAGTTLRRIAAKIDHPSFGYRNPTSGHLAAIRFDVQCDFILWLSGKDFTAKSHETTIQKHRRGKPGSAPFPALYMYRDQEKRSGIVLKRSDFDWDFLCWASRYLETSVDSILESSQSLVHVIDNEHRRRRSEQEIRLQRDASSKALLQGWEKTINRRNDLNRIALDLTVRGMKIPIPYLTEDGEIMRRQERLSILLKVDFAENQPSSALCAPNARRCDPAYSMRMKCTYVLKKQEEIHWRDLWVTQGRKTPTHMRLCQMNSLADHVKGRDKQYTLSQPHRFICASLYKRNEQVKGNHYTICEEADCEGCAGIQKTKW